MKQHFKTSIRRIFFGAVLPLEIVSLLFLSSCSNPSSVDDRFIIVTTTGMIKDAVQNIVGEKAEVIALMGAGVDPHLYKASYGDLEHLLKADIIFYNGLHLEGKMGEILKKVSRTKPVIAVTDGVPKEKLRKIPDTEYYDPHIWFDVKLWKHAVSHIGNTLLQYDSSNAQELEGNIKKYLNTLDSLHESVKDKVGELPPARRIMITAHDAFGYFGDAYGLKVVGLQGISTLSEFGLRDVTNLVDFIIEKEVPAIFIETSVSDRSIKAVIEGAQEQGWNVKIGGSLYSDAMGAEGTVEGTYVGMVNKNINTIVEALK